MGKKLTEKDFIAKARVVHGDKYDYSKVEYINTTTKVCIICPEHGEFWQVPSSHLCGIGCPLCGIKKASLTRKASNDKFIEKAKKIHGDKYDYSKVKYENSHKKVCIICPEHGEFWQVPYGHLNGYGCNKCGCETTKKKTSYNAKDFIKEAKKIHGDKYDYSKVDYMNNRTKVCIICPEHGEFWQSPYNHKTGQGCPICGRIKANKEKMMTTSEWVKRAKEIHGDKYDYSKTEYKGYSKKLKIVCKKHGEFEQLSYDHLQGKGCPKCRRSKLEIEISNFLREKNIKFIEYYRPKFLSSGKSHLSLDFFLPEYNAAIECQGKQHFKEDTFFDKRKEKIRDRDRRKYNLCKYRLRLFYYSNFKVDNYFDTVYNVKEELLKKILSYDEKRLLQDSRDYGR